MGYEISKLHLFAMCHLNGSVRSISFSFSVSSIHSVMIQNKCIVYGALIWKKEKRGRWTKKNVWFWVICVILYGNTFSSFASVYLDREIKVFCPFLYPKHRAQGSLFCTWNGNCFCAQNTSEQGRQAIDYQCFSVFNGTDTNDQYT